MPLETFLYLRIVWNYGKVKAELTCLTITCPKDLNLMTNTKRRKQAIEWYMVYDLFFFGFVLPSFNFTLHCSTIQIKKLFMHLLSNLGSKVCD